MTRPPDQPRSDLRAQPDDLTSDPKTDQPTDPPTDPMTDPVETNAMSTDDRNGTTRDVPDPTADPVADPAAGTGASGDLTADPTADPTSGPATGSATGPAATTEVPAASTQALPSGAPFRVEPSAPVPDDVVAPGSELPHLPPPPAAARPAPQLPPAPQAVRQPAPHPALVTVDKGPRPATVMLGLLAVLVAAYLLLANLSPVVGFAVSGPTFVGAFGAILLLVGLAGVVAGRLRRR